MITWDDAKEILQNLSNEKDSTTLTFLYLMTNQGYKIVFNLFNSEHNEVERVETLQIGERHVHLPTDATWLSSLALIDGTTKYPLIEVKSKDTWTRMTANEVTGLPQWFFVRPGKGAGVGMIELDPIPGSAYQLEVTMETTEKDLSQAKHTTGTVALMKDSRTVSGTGTAFTQAMVGRYLKGNDGLWYRIAVFESALELTLEKPYQGEDYSGSYEISEIFSLKEDLHMLPLYYGLWHYYASRREKQQASIYKNLYEEGVKAGIKRYSGKTRDTMVGAPVAGMDGMFISDYPAYFPQNGVS